MSENPLSGKVALITGAARRIGAEIAKILHAAGLNVVLHYNQSASAANEICSALNQMRPHSAALVAGDLRAYDQLADVVAQALSVWGRLDVLVNNASAFYRTPLAAATNHAWEDLMAINLRAPFFLAKAAMPSLNKTQGLIVNITDIHADKPMRDYSIYCISKAGLLMMTKQLAKELAPIRVNAVAPGAIMWPEGENSLSAEEKQKIIKQIPLACSGTASDVALSVLFFVKDGNYVSGQVLAVDGGRAIT